MARQRVGDILNPAQSGTEVPALASAVDAFLSKLEVLLGRRVRPLPVGRPRKARARGKK